MKITEQVHKKMANYLLSYIAITLKATDYKQIIIKPAGLVIYYLIYRLKKNEKSTWRTNIFHN